MNAAGTQTLDDLVRTNAAIRESMPAVVFGASAGAAAQCLSHGALDARCREFADSLARHGVGRGDVVGLLLPNGPEFAIALLGILRAGAVAMPIQALSTAREIAYVFDHARCRTVVTTSAFRAAIDESIRLGAALATLVDVRPGWTQNWPVESLAALPPQGSSFDPATPANKAPAILLYSSGSTARPKGIVLSHEAALAAAQCNAWHQALRPEDRHGIVLPMYHCNALFVQFFAALSVGASVYFCDSFSPEGYWNEMRAGEVTVGDLVAAGIRKLLQQSAPVAGGRMRLMLYGMPLKDGEMSDFETRYGCPLATLYGLTETAACGARSPIYGQRRTDRLGLPMPAWEIRVFDDNGKDCEKNVPGEIWLKGPSMFSGYLNEPGETARSLRDGGLLTGDIGFFDDDGYLVLLDRKKDLIKVRARSVGSLEIESVLGEHPAVREVSVIGVPDDRSDERIVAFVVLGDAVSDAELASFCAARLSHYKVPREFVRRERLPKTSVGKTRKGELKDAYRLAVPDAGLHSRSDE